MKEMLKAMGITVVEKGGYEADDILGTIAKQSEAKGLTVSVVSGDRDLLQLATDRIKIRIPKTKRTGTEIEDYNTKEVIEKYQVTPIEFIDVKALMGDTSDNIPGVPGIGEKTATAIIAQYGSIENAYAHVDEIRPPRASRNLKENYELAQMSKTLATIEIHAAIPYELEQAKIAGISSLYTEEAYLLCKRLEFKNLLGRFEVDTKKSRETEQFHKITSSGEAKSFLASLKGRACGFKVVLSEKEERLLGLAVCVDGADTAFLQIGEKLSQDELLSLFLNSEAASYATLDLKPQLKPLGLIEKKKYGSISLENLFDDTIAAYLLNPIKNEYPYEDIAKDYLSLFIPSRADLIGKQTYEAAMAGQEEAFLTCVCYQAYVAAAAKEKMEQQLKETGMFSLFSEIEMPLVFTLADMENEGIIACGDAL